MTSGIRSALAIIVTWGMLFALWRPPGAEGIVLAIVFGFAISGVIILAGRKNLDAIIRVTVGALVGALLGIGLLSPIILSQVYIYDHGFGEAARSDMLGTITGALVGSLFASMVRLTKTSTPDPRD